MPSEVVLEPLKSEDIPDVVDLVRDSMNDQEAQWVRQTLDFHFSCRQADIPDGRTYFVYRTEKTVCAIAGLHHYQWGPPENVWLAWFAVHPDYQRKGLGGRLIREVESRAMQMGYTKIFIETYEHTDFEKARAFYQSNGFSPAGTIEDYLPDGSAMLVYRKNIK